MTELSEFIHILDHGIMNRTSVDKSRASSAHSGMIEFSEFIHILDHDIMNRTPVGTTQSILNSFRYDRVQRVHSHPGPRHHE
jgi:hypothetical protein